MRILREILVHAQHQWTGGGDAGGQYWWRDRQGAVGGVRGQEGRVDAALPHGSSSVMLSDSRMHPVSCKTGPKAVVRPALVWLAERSWTSVSLAAGIGSALVWLPGAVGDRGLWALLSACSVAALHQRHDRVTEVSPSGARGSAGACVAELLRGSCAGGLGCAAGCLLLPHAAHDGARRPARLVTRPCVCVCSSYQ